MYGWYGGDWGVGGWIAMTVMMVLFWGGLITLVVWLVRRPTSGLGGDPRPTHHDAERILSERFARGEIDEDEFTTRRAALRRT